jgi:hypothetical protein
MQQAFDEPPEKYSKDGGNFSTPFLAGSSEGDEKPGLIAGDPDCAQGRVCALAGFGRLEACPARMSLELQFLQQCLEPRLSSKVVIIGVLTTVDVRIAIG